MLETFNPILSKEDVRGWSLTKEIPVPEPNTVLVLSRSGGELSIISHTDSPIPFRKFKFGGYNFLYKVDTGNHVLKIDCFLPSKVSGFDFPTTVEITCSVSNPQIIVGARTQDVASVLKARLIDEMKIVSRDYDLRENSMAEKDINRSVRRKVVNDRCFDDLGLRVSQLVTSLQIDSSAIEKIKKITLTELNEAASLAEKAAELRIREAELKLEQAEEAAQFRLDELKRMRASANQEHYEKLVRGGEVSLLAAYLAQNPEGIAELIKRSDRQTQLSSESDMQMLKVLLEEDAIEGSQLDETRVRVLRRLMGSPESPRAALKGSGEDQNQGPPSLVDDDTDDEDVDSAPN